MDTRMCDGFVQRRLLPVGSLPGLEIVIFQQRGAGIAEDSFFFSGTAKCFFDNSDFTIWPTSRCVLPQRQSQ